TPASVDSIPSSAMQEDHVSMGWGAARKLRQSLDNLARVLAVEIYAAARAADLRDAAASPVTGAVISLLRETVPGPGSDRFRHHVGVGDQAWAERRGHRIAPGLRPRRR
ncbi:aromatic amino acid lyase, partial [Brevibacterium paucivorans]